MDLQKYLQHFRTEIYRLAREDFEDSFTPGDTEPSIDKPVVLPLTWFREKAHIVETNLARRGLRTPAGFTIEAAAQMIFNEDGDEMSMRSNPHTPGIPKEMFEVVDYYKLLDEAAKLQFRGAVTNLANLYLKRKFKLTELDFEIQGKGDELNRKATVNQYRRYVIGEMLIELIRLAYEVTPAQIDEIMQNSGVMSGSTAQLKDSGNRKAFAAFVGKLVQNQFGGQKLGQIIIKSALR